MAGGLDAAVDALLARGLAGREFLRAQFDAGLAWVDFPVGRGGLGLSRREQEHVDRRLAAAGHPRSRQNPIGYGYVASILVRYGTPEQQERFLRETFDLTTVWCQLFSEPEAGSDLGSLRTQAVRDGAGWVVNGQKVWTSLAHRAQWGILLARTDTAAAKHKGLSFFLLDISTPGIRVRPIRQLTGRSDEFNEVFLRDVRLPADAIVGTEGQGWQVAMSVLGEERYVYLDNQLDPAGLVADFRALAARDPAAAQAIRDAVLGALVQGRVTGLLFQRAARLRDEAAASAVGSLAKLAFAETNQLLGRTWADVRGAGAMLYSGYDCNDGNHTPADEWAAVYLRTLANSLEGGTSQVQRDLVAHRVLGLPR